jgi:hypothetical protein
MRRAFLLLGCLSSAACLEPVRTGPLPGGQDDPGKFDRPEVSDERCDNGLDDDGNGQVDEGCPCAPGTAMDCYLGPAETREVGACMSGTAVCSGDESTEFGSWGACELAVGPSAESCNGEDDDCNGLVDDASACGLEDGECNTDADCGGDQTCAQGACVGTGALRFTLVWDLPGDLDLRVVTPTGSEIDFRTLSADGGQLDRDDRDGTGPENIFWDIAPPAGRYYVCIVPFRIDAAAGYTLTIENDGEIDQETGTIDPVSDPYNATCGAGSSYLITEVSVR